MISRPENQSQISVKPLLMLALTFSISLIILRLPLLSIYGLPQLSRPVLLLPFAICILALIVGKSFRWNLISGVLLSIFLWGCFYVVALDAAGSVSLTESIQDFLSKYCFVLFLFLAYGLRVNNHDINKILRIIAYISIFVIGPLFVVEYIGYRYEWLKLADVINFLIPPGMKELYGDGYTAQALSNNRPIGLYARNTDTAFLVAGASFFLTSLGSEKKGLRFYSFFIGALAIAAAGSFSLLISVLLTVLVGVHIRQIWKIFSKYRFLLFPFILAIIFSFYKSPLVYRWGVYSNIWGVIVPMIKPDLSDCLEFPLWTGVSSATYCHLPEIKILAPVFVYGLFSMLPFLLLICLPAFETLRKKIVKEPLSGELLWGFLFFLSLGHYSTVERWGNNLIYGLCLLHILNGWEVSKANNNI